MHPDMHTHRLRTLKIVGHRQQLRHVLPKPQILQRLCDVLARDRLLSIFLRNIVRLGREHCDELDAALDQEVSSLFCEGHGGALRLATGFGFRGEDFADDLLYCRFGDVSRSRGWSDEVHREGWGWEGMSRGTRGALGRLMYLLEVTDPHCLRKGQLRAFLADSSVS